MAPKTQKEKQPAVRSNAVNVNNNTNNNVGVRGNLRVKKIRYRLGRPLLKLHRKLREVLSNKRKVNGLPSTRLEPKSNEDIFVVDVNLILPSSLGIIFRIMGHNVYGIAGRRGNKEGDEWVIIKGYEDLFLVTPTVFADGEAYGKLGVLSSVSFGPQALEAAVFGIIKSKTMFELRPYFRNLCLMICEPTRLKVFQRLAKRCFVDEGISVNHLESKYEVAIHDWSRWSEKLADLVGKGGIEERCQEGMRGYDTESISSREVDFEEGSSTTDDDDVVDDKSVEGLMRVLCIVPGSSLPPPPDRATLR